MEDIVGHPTARSDRDRVPAFGAVRQIHHQAQTITGQVTSGPEDGSDAGPLGVLATLAETSALLNTAEEVNDNIRSTLLGAVESLHLALTVVDGIAEHLTAEKRDRADYRAGSCLAEIVGAVDTAASDLVSLVREIHAATVGELDVPATEARASMVTGR